MTPEQLAAAAGGTWIQPSPPGEVAELVIDSRRINDAAESIFVALRSSRRDGHQFIEAAYNAGVRRFLINEAVAQDRFPDAGFLLVRDTLAALQLMAANHRRGFTIPVVGITGSNGKTMVKEWLYQALGADFQIVRSPRSYNSQIGVPMSVWLMKPEHTLAIFEAGISQPGEMENLERIIRPGIGIFTSIGAAHSEGFLNIRQKINEKLLLFRHSPG